MNRRLHDLVLISENRLLAEATGAALVVEGAISSFVYVRSGQEAEFLETMCEQPAIVVFDATPYADRAELFSRIRRLAQQLPAGRIIAIGNNLSRDWVTGCIESGATTFVLAMDSLSEFAATVRALQSGRSRCSGAVIKVVLKRIRELSAAKHQQAGSDSAELTQRELDVLELVEQGLLNKEIARRLGIAISTVKNHLHAVFEKLQATGRRQAVRQGIALGALQSERNRSSHKKFCRDASGSLLAPTIP